MKYRLRVANGSKVFNKPVADLWVTRESITVKDIYTVPMAQLASWSQKRGVGIDDEFIRDYISDIVSDRPLPGGILLGMDDSKPLYLEYKGKKFSHLVVGDQIVVSSERFYSCRGPGYDLKELQEVDLSKFRIRYYDDNDIGERNRDDCPVDTEFLKYSYELDYQLFNGWVIHQFMSKIFPCTFDPFYEKDGLIHQRHKKYGSRWPKYEIPAAIDYHSLMKSLRIAEMYHDDDYLNVQ